MNVSHIRRLLGPNWDFSRVSPRDSFSWENHTWGAFEVTGRFSYTDLDDRNIRGGRLSAITGGITWYPHSHVRLKFNYVHGNVTGAPADGRLNIFETRVEIDF